MIRLLKQLLLAVGLVITGLIAILRPRSAGPARAVQHPAAAPKPIPGKRGLLKKAILALAALGIVGALGGFLVAASGIIPIKASSGHWAITAWFLNFSMGRSVSTHSLSVKHRPALDDPALILKGAGHYAIGCQPCHGSPGFPQPRVAKHMTPHPPFLPPKIEEWDPEELFYIVKHGVKFTGMPGWPATDRDDEIWAMTAFLLQLPDLSPEDYHLLAFGEAKQSAAAEPLEELSGPSAPSIPSIVQQNCARCHGTDGLGRGTGAFPRLAGQHREYLEAALKAYAEGTRSSGIMEPVAAALSAEDADRIAEYYSSLSPAAPASAPESTEAIRARGEKIALEGIPKKRVPACAECHGPNPTERNPHYPSLAGQYASYLQLQLELFQKHHRGGSDYSHLMHPTAERLSPEEIQAVSLYFASLPTSEK